MRLDTNATGFVTPPSSCPCGNLRGADARRAKPHHPMTNVASDVVRVVSGSWWCSARQLLVRIHYLRGIAARLPCRSRGFPDRLVLRLAGHRAAGRDGAQDPAAGVAQQPEPVAAADDRDRLRRRAGAPYSGPLAELLGFQRPSAGELIIQLGIICAYAVSTEALKHWFYRHLRRRPT